MAVLQVLLCLCALLQPSMAQENRRPFFDPGEYFGVRVTEGALTDTHVVTVTAVDLDLDVINYIIEDGSEGFRDFKVENTTGRVLVKSDDLDRESQARYSVTVKAFDVLEPPLPPRRPADYASVTFLVSIGDINDEAPEFQSPLTNLSVGEEVTNDFIITTYFAEDPDTGAGQFFTFSIGDQTVPFSIGQDSGTLSVSGPLDYDEGPIEYSFPIFATDHGTPPQSASIHVIIHINDFDDLPPKFTMERYYQTLRENDTIGTLVHVVSAYDQDRQLNYPVVYDVQSVALEDDTVLDTDLFSINATSGMVITNHTLNYELYTKYIITVQATEVSSTGRSSTAVIELTIADLNDNFPVFEQMKYTMNVTENTRVTEDILTVTAVDIDGELHNSFEYAIVEPAAMDFFSIDASTGVITLIKALDFESAEMHAFTVIATETVGMGTNNGTTDVELSIVNENDEAPMFSTSSYTAAIAENSGAAAFVFALTSSDRDKPPYDERTYQFAANSTNTDLFEVDANTGAVRVSNSSFPDAPLLDFDGQDNSFTLTLEVTDGAQTDRASLTVSLEPVNDNPPFVLGNSTQYTTANEGQLGTVVHVLSAQDADSNDAHSTLTWCITGGNEEGKFGLQISVGDMVTLTTVSALDYEARTEYDLTIYVTDGENCSTVADEGFFNDDVRVRVTVLDVNDRAPVFSSDNYTFFINETDNIGTSVGSVNASDMDSDAILTYSINSDLFTIDNMTGLITTGQMIDREMLPSNPITFIVSVQDRHPSSEIVLSATSMVTVVVNDVNDNKPRFSQPDGYTVTFEEGVVGLTFSFTVSDADYGVNGNVNYEIIGGDPENQFSLNANASGEVTLEYARFLDRENYTHYNLTVQATDSGFPSMSATAIIYITVSDVNDNDPVFTGDFSTNIPEDAFPGSVVNTVIATDLDQGPNAELSYFFSVMGGTLERPTLERPTLERRTEVFSINEMSGEIQTTDILDRETQAIYELTVVVTDGGATIRSGTTTVTVCVTDINDNAPVFVDPTEARSVLEDFEVGSELFRVSTTDGDNIGTPSGCPSEGINSSVIYSLVFDLDGNYSQLFEVNETSGSVSLSSRLDYDTQDNLYVFSVQATDRNGMEPAMSDFLTVVISVLPVNDNPPEFQQNSYIINVTENTAVGTTFTLLLATDADIGGEDGVIMYSSSITDPVEIDTQRGDLRVKGQLDFEGPNKTIEFIAMAYNPGSPELNDIATVTVIVLDENDEAPVFANAPYSASISEGNYSTEVDSGIQVSAVDADSPANSAITFSLADNHGGLFRIDSVTGTIYARGFFDAESDITEYTLTVVATDSGTPAMSTTAIATINIMDINDNEPVLAQSQYSFELSENDNQTQVLFTVSASDADVNKNNNGRLQFQLSNDVMNAFAVNATTGVVTFTGTVSFDREAPIDTYVFEVEVADSGATPFTSTATVTVTILDENDNRPMFDQVNYGTVSLPESTAVDYVIVTVSAGDGDQGDNGQVTYELVRDFGFFAINSSSGVVTLMQSLDYESSSLSYMLTIVAKDLGTPQLSDMATLNIAVTNVLDTAPIISDPMYAGSLPEAAQNGDAVLTVNVTGTDADATLSITLIGDDSNRFKVSNDGVIAANGGFDYEAGDRVFMFQVVASYSASLADTASVTVTITDVNDHAPVFIVQPRYEAQITAGSAIGTTVFSILATDEDSGSNDDITYSFAPNVSSEVRGLFSLDNETGIMQITSDIVYNPNNFMFLFHVVATDGGDSAMSSVTEVLVTVTDDNTNAPTFNQTQYTASIRENVESGTDVLQVFAMDPENNPITYQLTSGSTSATYFVFDGNTIKTNALLDREAIATHTFTVQAMDNGLPPKSGFALVTITVLDFNDNPPVFEGVPITFELTENPLVDQSVGIVSAIDEDILENADIEYSGSNNNFMVDPASGQIRVINPVGLDREENPTLSLTITASDSGVPRMATTTTVAITLRDVNDELPMFERASYAGMIMEGSPPDNFVEAVSATDPDLGDAIVYAIEEGDDPDDPKFIIDNQGRILTSDPAKRLDREEVAMYTLTVTATDLAGQKGTTTVTVSVMDVNDNAPEFTVGTTYTIHREETYPSSPNPVFISTLTATDPDAGNNGELTYSVTSDSSGLFYFEGTSVLLARCCVDRENPMYNVGEFGVYTIDVMATDGADNQTQRLSATLKLTINVSDYNDNPPVFPVPFYSVSINETSPPNSVVTQVMAVDPDFGINSVIDYDLTGSNLFRVDSATGVVRVSGDVRFSATGTRSYDLSIVARDRGIPTQFSSVDLTVLIIDENDNAPRFSQTLYLQSISESSVIGTEVEVVMATDSDLDAVIVYSLEDTFSKFAIDEVTGNLTLLDTLDREEVESYTVLVVARDSPSDPQFATATVQVTVVDANDNAPTFSQSFYNATVLENSRGGVFVEDVSASDLDTGNNGLVRYALTGIGAGNFAINENTGIVTVSNTASLDREMEDDYVLTVTASDSGIDPLTSTVIITITLLDVNDNIPMFTQANYPLSIPEDFYQGTAKATSLQVSATDLDGDMNLRYSITAGADNLFDIDSANGNVIVIGELDRETKMTYDLVVTATDSGPVSFRGSATVTVTLTDVNDNAPIFTEAVYRSSIAEASIDRSQFIVTVSANDADSGTNSVVRYSLTDYTSLFDINAENGDVFSRQEPFDREVRDSYTVTVVAMDTGSPESLNATASVVITLIDINDGIPYFDLSRYIVDVLVPSTDGMSFARLVANDDDSGINAELEYRLSSNPHDFILSDTTSGLIVANSNLSAALADTSYTLTVSAVDRGSPRRTGTTTLLVNFLSANDTRPLFDSSLFEINVPENSMDPVNSVVMATSIDTITFMLVESFPNNTRITTSPAVRPSTFTGTLLVDSAFDREEREFYSVNVIAESSGGTTDGYAILFVTIGDVNDNSPIFQNDPYFAEVTEGVAKGFDTEIVVMATDEDNGVFGTVSYSLTRNQNSTFSINPTTGVLTVNNSVDRETNPTYDLIVEATDGDGIKVSAPITITVADINDNPPVFQGTFDRTINESFGLVERVVTVVATDADDGINSRLAYSFDPSVGPELPFFIDSSTGVIRTARELDFDSGVTGYDITVIATDGGIVPQSASTSFRITITDVNDCTPTFAQPSYTVSIMENAQIGSVVQNVIASDCDTGDNSNVTYTIVRGNEGQVFRVVGGVVQVNGSLDYEQDQLFIFTVEARDNGVPPLSSSAEVTVFITDVNDNSPVFANISLPIEISEATSPGSTIATMSATDADSGDNARINYYVSEQGDDGVFAIDDPNSGVITLTQALDRDLFSPDTSVHYWVVVRAEDLGIQKETSFYNVTIQLTDVNDNRPRLINLTAICEPGAPSDASVREGAVFNTFVYQVNATDNDTGLNAVLSYTITGGNTGEVFSISDDGRVTVKTSPDRENELGSINSYTLTIEVADRGNPTLTRTGCLKISVEDINDFAPAFSQESYSGMIIENEIQSTILTVIATDRDKADTPNADITFSWCGEAPDNFEMNTNNLPDNTIAIGNTVGLDCEEQSSYDLCITAANVAGEPPMAMNATVTITCIDINDNSPMFNSTQCEATLNETAPTQDMVITLSAYDEDQPGSQNSALVWLAPTVDNPFHLDASTGVIRVQSPLDHETDPQYTLTYTVRDSGIQPMTLSSTIVCTFTIADENDNPPRFSESPFNAIMLEGATSTSLVTIRAEDVDELQLYKDHWFGITGWSPDADVTDLFTINASSGVVSLNSELDRETADQYTVQLRVTNTELGVCPNGIDKNCPLYTEGSLIVTVSDANDNPPVFTEALYTADLPSSSNPGYNVKQVVAMDADDGVNSLVTYSLQEPANVVSGTFAIDSESGQITLTGSVQQYEGDTLKLAVMARDRNGQAPYNEAGANVSITVVGDIQRIALQYSCNRSYVNSNADRLRSILGDLTNLTIPYVVVTGSGEESTVTLFAQDPQTNLLVSFVDLEALLFDSYLTIQEAVPDCSLLSIRSDIDDPPAATPPGVTELIPLFALCGVVAAGAFVVMILAANQRRATRRQRKKDYLGNIFFGTATDVDAAGGLMQLEQVGATEEITHENPVFIDPFKKWENVDTSREASHVAESAASLTRGNPVYESQEIRMEMFQEGADSELGGEDDELLAEALRDDSEDEDDILVTAI